MDVNNLKALSGMHCDSIVISEYIHSLATVIGTPVTLLHHAVIQSANRGAYHHQIQSQAHGNAMIQ